MGGEGGRESSERWEGREGKYSGMGGEELKGGRERE